MVCYSSTPSGGERPWYATVAHLLVGRHRGMLQWHTFWWGDTVVCYSSTPGGETLRYATVAHLLVERHRGMLQQHTFWWRDTAECFVAQSWLM